jgi:ERCC4-type nuclease
MTAVPLKIIADFREQRSLVVEVLRSLPDVQLEIGQLLLGDYEINQTTARQAYRIVSGGLPRPGYRPKGKRKVQERILQGVPGVGPARAARLLDTFGTVEKVLLASIDNLAEVQGIGRQTAEKMRWAVSETPFDGYTAAALSEL